MVCLVEAVFNGAVDIQQSGDAALGVEGQHDFRTAVAVAGDMPREGVDVRHPLDGVLSPGGAADALIPTNAGTGRFSTALKMGQKNKRATAEVSQYETVLLQFDKLVIQNQELLEQPYIRETIFSLL